ncbi:hypothetical protein Dsin_018963 [Dipteronia sinensis]|uniref:CCHC-type domain-containing protein n=1 Tax=Dipteronia sinensis TaxID=43782 RepID=A0AAE0A6A7_9ROSI|nr:hypothetical protein Dsin_018963 [Dipteronia sinensis]
MPWLLYVRVKNHLSIFARITIRNRVWLKHILEVLDQSDTKASEAGRPKKIRIPSTREYRGKKSRTCSWCKQAGHNRQNCPTPFGFIASNTIEAQPTQTRKQHKCHGCGGQGHNKRTCPHRQTSTRDSGHDEDDTGV